MCKRAFVLRRNRIFAPTDDMLSSVTAIKNHPGMGCFPDRELATFQTQAALGKVSSAAYYCSAEV
jgi:hypothetical protein